MNSTGRLATTTQIGSYDLSELLLSLNRWHNVEIRSCHNNSLYPLTQYVDLAAERHLNTLAGAVPHNFLLMGINADGLTGYTTPVLRMVAYH